MSDRLLNISETWEKAKVAVEFVDEKSSNNPFNDYDSNHGIANSDIFEISDQERKISNIGEKEARLFRIKDRGEILEIGWGGNGYFAEGIFNEAGVPISILDSDSFEDSSGRLKPPTNAVDAGRFNLNFGLAQELNGNVDLKGKKFGTILFHGSLFGSGYNWTIQQSLARGVVSEKVHNFVDQNIDMVLQGAKDHLASGGQLVITSDRFSLYSAGRAKKEVPLEKLEFLDVIEKAINLKAKKITIVGVSTDGVLAQFSGLLGEDILNQLTSGVEALPDNTKSDYLSRDRIMRIKDETKDLVTKNIALIDAISIQF